MAKYNRCLVHIACSFLLAIAGEVKGENSYVLISPNVARPGRDFTIHGTLLKRPSRPVTITAELQANGVVASATAWVTGKEAVKLDLPVPTSLNIGDRKTMRLELRGSGGLTFSESKNVNFDPKSVSVYIQTDKKNYKPGQTVKFRVFGTSPDLRIVYDKLKVELYDPKGNKINQWDVSGAELTNLNGVYVQEQIMSTEPVLGEWKLRAKLLSYSDEFEEKAFTVAEYVLPKFEVKLDLPSFGRYDISSFKGTIKAKYTFGQPVKGIVDLRIKPKNERFQIRDSQRVSVSKTIELKMPINGETTFTLPVSRLKTLSGTTYVFEANVTEDQTKFRQSDDEELTFHDTHIKLKFPKSLPDTFKPGMIYDSVVIVSQQDETPPDTINGALKVTITEYRMTHSLITPVDEIGPIPIRPSPRRFREGRRATKRIMPPWRPSPRETSKVLPPVTYPIPADGFVTFPIDVNKDLTKLRIKAEYSGRSVTKTLKKRHSPSNTYLQMRLLSRTPTAGQSARIEMKSTKVPHEFTYQIYSRGTIVESGTVPMRNKKLVWTPSITAAMTPRAKIVAFFVQSDGEIIADVLVINIEGSVYDNQVAIQFSKNTAAPADKIRLDVTANPGSNVHVLGVDKSVLLLASGNDITNQQILQELRQFDTKSRKSRALPFVCDWRCLRWPVSVGGEDAKDVFLDAGVLVFTDALVYDHIEPPIFRPFIPTRMPIRNFGGWGGGRGQIRRARPMAKQAMGKQAMAARPMAVDFDPMVAPGIAAFDFSVEDLAPVKRTRTLFPETWLWETRKVHNNGTVSIEETVPDTITSWIASAFAVHPTSGLGVANPSPQLTVSLPFFVTVNLPYSVIHGEKVMIQVILHNYSPQNYFSMVTFSKSDSFKNIIIKGTTQITTSQDIVRVVNIPSNDVISMYFPILPERIGLVDIKITAQSSAMSDAILKRLLVEAEGTPREYNIPILVDLGNGGSVSKTAEVTYPLRKVAGSEVVRATVIGDLMGPSISGLDALLKLPYGCGEQNMLNFAPNIFIIKYLKATQSADENVLKKAKDFMQKGYQRELTYSHSDGSFSAFGERDPSGSTWLTAFVIKSFVQAKPYIFIDENVIHKAIDWLIKQQQPDGTFIEPGRVIHKAMQGGSIGGKTSLTAYVLISLLEARVVEGIDAKISSTKARAQSYLDGQVLQLTDVYDLAIVSYALELAGSRHADAVWNLLDAKHKAGSGTKYWEKVSNTDDVIAKPWTKRNGVAVNIELTSYALLTLAHRTDRVDGVKVLKWVTEQRNPNGGFSSTQDTVLALQGLAEMAAIIYSPHHDVTVAISGTGFSDTLHVTDLNANILQIRDLPPDIGNVQVTASGTGLAFIQIEVQYNIDDDDQKKSFDLTVTMHGETFNSFEVEACARWLERGSSSMAVLEIGSLSGFVADITSVHTKPEHKRMEMDTRKLILYFDEIGSTQDTCATVTMQRIGMVASAQPVAVTIFDYYEPTKQRTKFYVPQILRDSEVCEVCGKGCDVCSAK